MEALGRRRGKSPDTGLLVTAGRDGTARARHDRTGRDRHGASGTGGNAGALIAESAPDCAAVKPVSPPEPVTTRPLRAALADEPARLLATDCAAVFGLAAVLASWRCGLLLAALSVAALAALGRYRRKLILSVVDDTFRVVAGIGMAWAATGWVGETVS